MKLGASITEHRERRGLSQRQLAEYLDVSHSYVSHIEGDRRNPSWKVLQRISTILEEDLWKIVRRAEELEEENAE